MILRRLQKNSMWSHDKKYLYASEVCYLRYEVIVTLGLPVMSRNTNTLDVVQMTFSLY